MKRNVNTQSIDYKLLFWKNVTSSVVLKWGLHTSLALNREVLHVQSGMEQLSACFPSQCTLC